MQNIVKFKAASLLSIFHLQEEVYFYHAASSQTNAKTNLKFIDLFIAQLPWHTQKCCSIFTLFFYAVFVFERFLIAQKCASSIPDKYKENCSYALMGLSCARSALANIFYLWHLLCCVPYFVRKWPVRIGSMSNLHFSPHICVCSGRSPNGLFKPPAFPSATAFENYDTNIHKAKFWQNEIWWKFWLILLKGGYKTSFWLK